MVIFHSYVKLPEGKHFFDFWIDMMGMKNEFQMCFILNPSREILQPQHFHFGVRYDVPTTSHYLFVYLA